LGSIGIVGGAAGTASFAVGEAVLRAGNKATYRGVWIRMGGKRVVSWGYQ